MSMKIVVTGTRGIPDIQGGVETHCQELYPRIAALGHDVTVIRRSCYLREVHRQGGQEYKGVHLKDLYAPRRKSLEAIIHTFLAVCKARMMGADIIHIHAIGPSLMAPFARMLGLKVVTTNHGPDYDRGKWGKMAKRILMTGEKWGAKRSHRVIVISQVIADILASRYGRMDTDLIFNGVPKPTRSLSTEFLEQYGIKAGKYVLAMGRFVQEKNFHLLIEAWRRSGLAGKGWKLVIGGDADHADSYASRLKGVAAHTPGVVLPGFVKGEAWRELMTNASLFVLPSSHEGLPIALLEAMSYGLDVLVSDIPANRLAELGKDDFFHLEFDPSAPDANFEENAERLSDALKHKMANPRQSSEYDLRAYDWGHIAQQTLQVYSSLL